MPEEEVKVSELDIASTINETDLVPTTVDPSGTPSSKAAQWKTILDKRLNFSIVPAAELSLTAGTGAQAAFPTTGDVITVAPLTTYKFEGQYRITKSGTTCTVAMLFALAGGASVTSLLYHAQGHNLAVNTTGQTQDTIHVSQVTATVITSTSTGEVFIKFEGLIRVNARGTITPQIQFSAAPTTPVMKADSYIMFTPIGGNTENVKGSFA